ncbi:MAG: HAD-IA family hydrolase [Ectothiorhodospiraceae bacterium]|nr:HAD-IA family hydrolase [Ectothiorhodospiraceae bacterium]
MPADTIKAVLFDLDGTLLDTAPDLIHAANQLRVEHGLEPLVDGIYGPVVSHGSAAMIQRSFNIALDDPRMQLLRSRFLELYSASVSQSTRPFDGMLPLLDGIEERGLLWGVVTNKPGWLTHPLLRALGLEERCACIVSGDTLPCRKPDPAPVSHACELLGVQPSEAVILGDAMRDVDAGQRAGTATLVALFGYICAEDRPTEWGADGLIGHPLDLLPWLDSRAGDALMSTVAAAR